MLFLLRAGENPSPEKKKEVEEYWTKRNVVFHSWRHFYASRMTDKLEARKIMLATGHKTESVFKGYSDHALESDLMDVAVTTGEVFGGLLPEEKYEGRAGGQQAIISSKASSGNNSKPVA
jgi:hypothetical protein